MSKHFMGNKNRIVVAANFDVALQRLIQDARDIAERTGMNLHFVHAIEPIADEAPRSLLRHLEDLTSVYDAIDESRQLQAEQRLQEILGQTDTEDMAILSGDPVRAVLAEALCNHAPLIMVAATASSYKFVPSGFSTALRLMAESQVPVLVVPYHKDHLESMRSRHWTKKRLKLLVADDLSPEGQDVVMTALDFARGLGEADVLHIHVSNITEGRISALMAEISTRSGIPNARKDAHDIALAVRKSADESLRERAPERIPLLEARGGTYRYEVVSGNPDEEITKAAEAFEADIICFGQHRPSHKSQHPFGVGKIPLQSMLDQKRLVMIVPPRYHG